MAKILLLILAMASGVLAEDCSMFPPVVAYVLHIFNAADQPASYYVETQDSKGTWTVAANSGVSVHGYKMGAWRVVLLTSTNVAALRQLEEDLTDKIKSQKLDPEELKSIQVRITDIRNQMAVVGLSDLSCRGTFIWSDEGPRGGDPESAQVTSARVGQEWVMRC